MEDKGYWFWLLHCFHHIPRQIDAITPGQSGPGNNGNEGVHHIP